MCTAFMDNCSYIIHFFLGAFESLWKNLLNVDFLESTNGEFDPKWGTLGRAFDFSVKRWSASQSKGSSRWVILPFQLATYILGNLTKSFQQNAQEFAGRGEGGGGGWRGAWAVRYWNLVVNAFLSSMASETTSRQWFKIYRSGYVDVQIS